MQRFITRLIISAITIFVGSSATNGQITEPRVIGETPTRTATLEEQLTNRLRAITPEQREYVRYLVRQVELKKLELKLVVAVERYAIRRNSQFPFPFFERAIRFEASKRGVSLPTVRQFTSARNPLITTARPQ